MARCSTWLVTLRARHRLPRLLRTCLVDVGRRGTVGSLDDGWSFQPIPFATRRSPGSADREIWADQKIGWDKIPLAGCTATGLSSSPGGSCRNLSQACVGFLLHGPVVAQSNGEVNALALNGQA